MTDRTHDFSSRHHRPFHVFPSDGAYDYLRRRLRHPDFTELGHHQRQRSPVDSRKTNLFDFHHSHLCLCFRAHLLFSLYLYRRPSSHSLCGGDVCGRNLEGQRLWLSGPHFQNGDLHGGRSLADHESCRQPGIRLPFDQKEIPAPAGHHPDGSG